MTHRERVVCALSHQQPDMVPIDLGSSLMSSIVLEGYERLKKYFGIESETKLSHRMMRIADVDEEILKRLDIDLRGVFPGTPKGTEDLGPNRYKDSWGIEREKPEHSYYYDQRKSPLSGDIGVSDIVNYPWPNPDDPEIVRGLKERVKWIRNNTDCAVALALPNPFVHISQYLRGFEDWYCDMALNPMVLEALFDAVLEVNLEIAKNELKEVGQDIDVVVSGDDLATQKGLQYSHDHFLKYVKPKLAKFFSQVHDMSNAKLLYHTCGSVVSIIEDLIEIGVEALNPVQLSAAGMDPVKLKKKYRGRLAFWGAIDSQTILPKGSVKDVQKLVEDRIEQLGEGGGYILCAVHNIQPDVPLENILAMYRHAREYIPSFAK